ncbi:MAG TPA: Rieske 2Fe-2S domain-containing protein [Candidatus Angelobacter sp.]
MPAKSFSNGSHAPARDKFPGYPASWYLFGAGSELNKGPLSKPLLGRRLVAFRTSGGKVAVMDAHCAHLGADLGRGSVIDETIQCPFHSWRYGTDGVCTHIPCGEEIPPFARLRTYPVEERHGYVFFFNGAEPLFPLPFFFGAGPRDFVAGKTFAYVADCTWYMNAAHAFDTQHFRSVHDRKLLAPPVIDCPAPFARRNSYHAEVVGDSIFDRLLRHFAGPTVQATLSIFGGNVAAVTADFGRTQSQFLMFMHPREDGQTLCQGIVYAPRKRSLFSFPQRLNLWTRRAFTHGYLAEEARRLRGTRYNPAGLGRNDQDMIDFFQWLVSLPQGVSTAIHMKASEGENENIPSSPDVPVGGSRPSEFTNTVRPG